MDPIVSVVGDITTTALLSRPACSQDVIHLQCALAAAGAFDGDIDGSFGPATSKAMADFEKSKGLAQTGLLTESSARLLGWKKLMPVPSRLPAVTPDLVVRLFSPGARPHIDANLSNVLNALAAAGLADRTMIAMGLATVRVEASQFLPVSELPSSFNTSPGGRPFDKYDGRASLGNGVAPDGSRFRGRGFIQLTGRANYRDFSRLLNLGTALVENPFLAHESLTSARILAAFLKTKENRIRPALGNNNLADARRVINGGTNGLNDFITAYRMALEILPKQLSTTQ